MTYCVGGILKLLFALSEMTLVCVRIRWISSDFQF